MKQNFLFGICNLKLYDIYVKFGFSFFCLGVACWSLFLQNVLNVNNNKYVTDFFFFKSCKCVSKRCDSFEKWCICAWFFLYLCVLCYISIHVLIYWFFLHIYIDYKHTGLDYICFQRPKMIC